MSFKHLPGSGLFVPSSNKTAENFLFSYKRKPKNTSLIVNESKALTSPYVLVVEDDEDLVHSLELIAEEKNINMAFAKNGGEGVSLVSKNNFDAVILDWNLPDFDGDEFIALSDDLISLHSKKNQYSFSYKVPVITFSGEDRKHTHLETDSKFFYKVKHWKKPMSLESISHSLAKTFCRHQEKNTSQKK